jgi:hypothetical protein
MRLVLRIEPDSEFPIVIGTSKKGNRPMFFNRQGSVLKNGTECLLFPDKDTTTWEGYITPIIFSEGDIVKAYNAEGKALIAIYNRFDHDKQIHYCFHSISEIGVVEYSEHVRVDKFRPKDGFFFAKRIFSKMSAAKIEKQGDS